MLDCRGSMAYLFAFLAVSIQFPLFQSLRLISNPWRTSLQRTTTSLDCVGTKLVPVAQDDGNMRSDSDNFWRTPGGSTIIPVKRDKFTERPELITFDGNTLIAPSQSIGRWYREALNTACDMRIRLPRPALFTAAFNKAYSDM